MGDDGNHEARDTATLFRDHSRFVVRFLNRLGLPDADLEDVVQEVFLVVHRKGGYRPGTGSPTTWLAEIALRTALARRRQNRRNETDPLHTADEVRDLRAGPEARLDAAESLELVRRALATLDLEKRAVFVLFELEGESGEDIAEALGVPRGTVYSRLFHARAEFTAALGRLTQQPRRDGA